MHAWVAEFFTFHTIIQVTITFTDVDGKTHKQTITDRWHNDFDKGKEDKFHLQLADLGKISQISVHRGASNKDDKW